MNHQNIENHPERISNIKIFINQYNWKGIDFTAHRKDQKKFEQEDWEKLQKNNKTIDRKMFEQNNKTIDLNILFVPYNTKTIRLAYKSRYNRKRKNQVVLLMITDGKIWHYLTLKSVRTTNGYNRPIRSLSILLRGITSKHNRDYYCLGCFHSKRTDNELKKHERLCDKNDYCHVKMPKEDEKILKDNHREKSLKVPFTIYADLECLLPKMHSCQNNLKKSYTERKAKHEPSGYSWSLIRSFDATNEHNFYRGRDCIEKFCKDLKDLAIKIINYEEKEMIALTDDEYKSYEKQKECHICKKEFCTNKNEQNKFKIYPKVRDHCHYTGKFRGAAHSICNLKYTKKSEIIVIILESLEELLIVFVI